MTTAALILIAACSWAAPGANPYQGLPADAVDSYADIPPDARARLRDRIERRAFDDIAAITRDRIQGRHEYTGLRDMHFGRRTVCGQPDRSTWTDSMTERGLVYCDTGHCLIVPTVCRNVARVTRLGAVQAIPQGQGGGQAMAATAAHAPMPAMPSFAELSRADLGPAPVAAVSIRGHTEAPAIAWPAPGPVYLIAAPAPPIPEPSGWLLMVAGLAGLAWLKWSAR